MMTILSFLGNYLFKETNFDETNINRDFIQE